MQETVPSIFKITGKVQHYAWGGSEFIPNLLSINNDDQKPCAEYWMGAHPSAASTINDLNKPLNSVIEQDKDAFLTPKINQQFGELPFLFKVLDVKEMLSIQVHPTKEEAVKGFEKEEALGISINAANRNYKDKNHKPEIMIALGEFWLLHGFLAINKIEEVLLGNIEFASLLPYFKNRNIKQLMEYVYTLPQNEVDNILKPLLLRENEKKQAGLLSKNQPGWWACKTFEVIDDTIKNIDRGIFSIYFFNIVQVQRSEAVFQAAGVPHAYLEGQNIELMANSDNVLRGGLTPKHVDVPELLKHTIFEPVEPNIMKGNLVKSFERNYPCPVPDFDISLIKMNANDLFNTVAVSPQIIINVEGKVKITFDNHSIYLNKGEVCFIKPSTYYTLSVEVGSVELYKAFVT
jgi:mannose-6-phosphate isomerase